LALGAAFTAAPANAVPIVGGTTAVTLTAAPTLTSLGLTVAPTGTATATINAGIPTVSFPITGGTQNDSTGALLLQHNGSGLLFTTSANSNSLAIGNFVVDSAAALVTGSATTTIGGVTNNLSNVSLFNIVGGNTLTLTSAASGAFSAVFNANLPAGTTVGTVRINAVAAGVPEPGTWMMMLLGFGAVGLTLRRRNRQLATA
jgi:hypothetical protein